MFEIDKLMFQRFYLRRGKKFSAFARIEPGPGNCLCCAQLAKSG